MGYYVTSTGELVPETETPEEQEALFFPIYSMAIDYAETLTSDPAI
jgi:hypothetical protein